MRALTDEELKEYAEHLIQQNAEDIEHCLIFEVYGVYTGDYDDEISEADGAKVHDLIDGATVTVTWP